MEKFEDELPYTLRFQSEDFDLESYFDLKKLVEFINKEQKKQVILQFPVFQLSEAIKVQSYISKNVENQQCKVYLLSDHLKQSCCVDVVGASHLIFDLIIHFGQACFSQKSRSDIIHVLPKIKLDTEKTEQILDNYFKEQQQQKPSEEQKETFVLFEQEYSYLQENFLSLNDKYKDCNIALINRDQNEEEEKEENNENKGKKLFYGYQTSKNFEQESEKNLILVSSNENSKLIEKLFFLKDKFKIGEIHILENQQIRSINFNLNKSILKRLHLVEQARNIDSFGVLITNPNTKFCQRVLKRTRKIIRKAGKKCFTFVMNNMNESKLNNFPEVDAYVIISCHNNSLFEYKTFYKLIVTPFELEMALDDVSFSSYFVIDGCNIEDLKDNQEEEEINFDDFDTNLCKKQQQCCQKQENQEEQGCCKQQQQSDGGCCQNKNQEQQQWCCKNQNQNKEQEQEEEKEEEKGQLNEQQIALKREQDYQIQSAKIFQTLDFYKNRLYQGLDIAQEVEVAKAKQGLSGIAQVYEKEKEY